jgi:hypothetical protein
MRHNVRRHCIWEVIRIISEVGTCDRDTGTVSLWEKLFGEVTWYPGEQNYAKDIKTNALLQ